MQDKKITVDAFDGKSWDNLYREVEEYKRWLTERAGVFAQKMSEEGLTLLNFNYERAEYAGLKDYQCDVVPVSLADDVWSAGIKAEGETVLFMEFGTGIAFANSHQFEYGFAPGSYGPQGLNRSGWLYKGPPGPNPPYGTEESYKKEGFTHTYGNPASAGMAEAINEIERKIAKIAQEVFA